MTRYIIIPPANVASKNHCTVFIAWYWEFNIVTWRATSLIEVLQIWDLKISSLCIFQKKTQKQLLYEVFICMNKDFKLIDCNREGESQTTCPKHEPFFYPPLHPDQPMIDISVIWTDCYFCVQRLKFPIWQSRQPQNVWNFRLLNFF